MGGSKSVINKNKKSETSVMIDLSQIQPVDAGIFTQLNNNNSDGMYTNFQLLNSNNKNTARLGNYGNRENIITNQFQENGDFDLTNNFPEINCDDISPINILPVGYIPEHKIFKLNSEKCGPKPNDRQQLLYRDFCRSVECNQSTDGTYIIPHGSHQGRVAVCCQGKLFQLNIPDVRLGYGPALVSSKTCKPSLNTRTDIPLSFCSTEACGAATEEFFPKNKSGPNFYFNRVCEGRRYQLEFEGHKPKSLDPVGQKTPVMPSKIREGIGYDAPSFKSDYRKFHIELNPKEIIAWNDMRVNPMQIYIFDPRAHYPIVFPCLDQSLDLKFPHGIRDTMGYQILHEGSDTAQKLNLKRFGFHARYHPEEKEGLIERIILGKLKYESFEDFLFLRMQIPEIIRQWCFDKNIEILDRNSRDARILRQRIFEMAKIGINYNTTIQVLAVCHKHPTYLDPHKFQDLASTFRTNQSIEEATIFYSSIQAYEENYSSWLMNATPQQKEEDRRLINDIRKIFHDQLLTALNNMEEKKIRDKESRKDEQTNHYGKVAGKSEKVRYCPMDTSGRPYLTECTNRKAVVPTPLLDLDPYRLDLDNPDNRNKLNQSKIHEVQNIMRQEFQTTLTRRELCRASQLIREQPFLSVLQVVSMSAAPAIRWRWAQKCSENKNLITG